MSPELYSLLFTKILPSLGVVVSVALSLSPMPSVVRLMRSESGGLQGINPIPYPFLFSNALGWLAYGAVQHDVMIILPNAIGGLLSLFYVVVCAEHGNKTERFVNRVIQFSTLGVLAVVVVVGMFAVQSTDVRLLMYGFTTNAILICFFTSPLSSMVRVVKTKDASSISLPIAVASLLNCALWVGYGIGKKDPFIYVPNGIGLASAVLQLVLKGLFHGGEHYEHLRGSPIEDRSAKIVSPRAKPGEPVDIISGADFAVVVNPTRDRRAARRESVGSVSGPQRLS